MAINGMQEPGPLQILAFRLSPGSDVRQAIEDIATREQISAGSILSAVGSLSRVQLRFAHAETPTELTGKHEILTLSGTLSSAGVHLHMTVANEWGECKGGHLVDGCHVHTTLELIIATFVDLQFTRKLDHLTGYPELVISSISQSSSSST
ncbi:PPC domain-containing DNA-binding protein [Acaryochloris sp. IP29b_bin.137]|uniref:PPC domain-containing DNA-binding protein n=1 Tax=Acaryochloris sp. IP29b_bin.137 TaxID=2969217 RepID=UPI002615C015|nr:PPC domain-containing DNA-binding protein [Acaryochloris sp. IP29b_bin.137]